MSSNNQNQTNDSSVSGVLIAVIPSLLMIAAIILITKFTNGDFHKPELQVGECVVSYNTDNEKLESWESQVATGMDKIEEIGDKKYRVTHIYIAYPNTEYKKLLSYETSTDIKYVDGKHKVDCREGMSLLWNSN